MMVILSIQEPIIKKLLAGMSLKSQTNLKRLYSIRSFLLMIDAFSNDTGKRVFFNTIMFK